MHRCFLRAYCRPNKWTAVLGERPKLPSSCFGHSSLLHIPLALLGQEYFYKLQSRTTFSSLKMSNSRGEEWGGHVFRVIFSHLVVLSSAAFFYNLFMGFAESASRKKFRLRPECAARSFMNQASKAYYSCFRAKADGEDRACNIYDWGSCPVAPLLYRRNH